MAILFLNNFATRVINNNNINARAKGIYIKYIAKMELTFCICLLRYSNLFPQENPTFLNKIIIGKVLIFTAK